MNCKAFEHRLLLTKGDIDWMSGGARRGGVEPGKVRFIWGSVTLRCNSHGAESKIRTT